MWRLLRVLEGPQDEAPNENRIKSSSFDKRTDQVEQRDSGIQVIIERQEHGWKILESLASSPSIARLLVKSSGWLQLIGILAGYEKFTKLWVDRKGAAKTLARLLWDPNTSPIAGTCFYRTSR